MASAILIRHLESTKNRVESFASRAADETLTAAGQAQAASLAKAVANLAGVLAPLETVVRFAQSARALATVGTVAEVLGATPVPDPTLGSITSPGFEGRTRSDLLMSDLHAARLLDLFRTGLLSADSVPMFSRTVEEFERVARHNLDSWSELDGLTIAVAHRSTITALLRGVAEQSLGYPAHFRGHINVNPGSVSLLLKRSSDRTWRIPFANLSAGDVERHGADLVALSNR